METFIYTPGVTTVDDVADAVFKALNTTHFKTYLDVKGYCRSVDDVCDLGMARLVVSKMYKFGVAQKWRSLLASDTEIEVTDSGIESFRGGMGWKWIIAAERAKAEHIARQLAEKEAEEKLRLEREFLLRSQELRLQEESLKASKGGNKVGQIGNFIGLIGILSSFYLAYLNDEKAKEILELNGQISRITQKADSLEKALQLYHAETLSFDSTQRVSKEPLHSHGRAYE